jgi:molybdopterin converting factor small subunit
MSKDITVQYYALLREERGLSSETLTTTAETPQELYELLQRQHQFSLPTEKMTVALNDAFSRWDAPLNTNDAVVFMPPVAGG